VRNEECLGFHSQECTFPGLEGSLCVCRRTLLHSSRLAPSVPVCYLPGKYSPALFSRLLFRGIFPPHFRRPCCLFLALSQRLLFHFCTFSRQFGECCQMFAALPVVVFARGVVAAKFRLLTFSTCQRRKKWTSFSNKIK